MCFGGFGLSNKAIHRLAELGNEKCQELIKIPPRYGTYYLDIARHDPLLVQVVEELKEEANGECANLKIAEVYSDSYKISDYDGKESILTSDNNDYEWVHIDQ